MDYSIIIPVFNKADLTRNCLRKLRPSLEGAGEGEVIVIDNASSDHTPEMLREFPWIRVIRNERNLGFSGANNQGAREAHGRFLVLLNNDTEPITTWLAPMLEMAQRPGVGAVGARLLYPEKTLQHAGVIVRSAIFNAAGFVPFHYMFKSAWNTPEASVEREYQCVTGACLVTPRDLYVELGGLDEGYWNGYEDVDYCFKVRERGLRVMYDPRATLFHFESQSGSQRFRKTQSNVRRLTDRWRGRVDIDSPRRYVDDGLFVGVTRTANGGLNNTTMIAPPTNIIVHGATGDIDRAGFEARLRANRLPVGNVIWADQPQAIALAREEMEVRGERCLAIVRADCALEPGWLDELVGRVLSGVASCASTVHDDHTRESFVPLYASDARCVVLRLRMFPAHVKLAGFDTLDGAVADLLVRMLAMGCSTIGVRVAVTVGTASKDESFERAHGMALAALPGAGLRAIEERLQEPVPFESGLVSIVMLSWNAPDFTLQAVKSIARHTPEPYEVIIVDNGSGEETLAALATIDDPHVRIVYNQKNRGFSGGNNDGIAHARGDYLILLNNDVLVTPNWSTGLVDAFRRIPTLGISAPRTNNITGDQKLAEVDYASEDEMVAFSRARAREYAEKGYLTDRAIGFCWCIPRRVLESIGALDERYTLGNFEDDDFCLRVRAAGYHIYVCDDVFIHHFGSRSFVANNVDYRATLDGNWRKFAEKWGFKIGPVPEEGYQGHEVYARGFDPAKHFIELPKPPEQPASATTARGHRAVFMLRVRSENDWTAAARFIKNYAGVFRADDGVALSIASFAEPDATTIAARVERILAKAGVLAEESGDIFIADVIDEPEWEREHDPAAAIHVERLEDRSPSAMRKLLAQVPV